MDTWCRLPKPGDLLWMPVTEGQLRGRRWCLHVPLKVVCVCVLQLRGILLHVLVTVCMFGSGLQVCLC